MSKFFLLNKLIQINKQIVLDPRIKQLSDDKMAEWRVWFDSRLDNAIEAAETQENPQIESIQIIISLEPFFSLFKNDQTYFFPKTFKNQKTRKN